MSLLARSGISL